MIESRFDYRIGLDIGITSVGWAVLQNNSKDEPVRIIDMGVRIFDKPENPKTGASLAAPRREKRTNRRRIRRRRHRIERIKHLLEKNGLINTSDFEKRYHTADLPDVYELRMKGLDELLTEEEFAQVLLHIAKHRGFKSNRKSDAKNQEEGKLLNAVKENQLLMNEKGYRTVGEMMFKDPAFYQTCEWIEGGQLRTTRNKQGEYRHTILRSVLVEEVQILFQQQREYGSAYATRELEEAYLSIMTSQRSFDEGPGVQADGTKSPYAIDGFKNMVGRCTLELDEYRAPKAAFTSELFVASQKINNLKMTDEYGDTKRLTEEERKQVLHLLFEKKEVKYADIRKVLQLGPEWRFAELRYELKKQSKDPDIEKSEKKTAFTLKNSFEICKALGYDKSALGKPEVQELIDSIAVVLSYYKSDDKRRTELALYPLTEEQIENLLPLNYSKFQNLSLVAMRKINPFLESGMTYDKACEAAGYDFKADTRTEKKDLLKGPEITAIINDITNPVVRRAVSQTVKVINAIVLRYGNPQAVHIELARELAKNFEERNRIEKDQKKNADKNEHIRAEIKENYRNSFTPKGQDILKYRLWLDQDKTCMYSGKVIPLDLLFTGAYEIDHIVPYSRSFDDSYLNKILVEAGENRNKGNRTPYEYFGNDITKWSLYESRVHMLFGTGPKAKRLLKKHYSEQEAQEFKQRNLNDTRYITTVVHDMLRNHLRFAPFMNPAKKKHVIAVNGMITSYMRKRWGLGQKDRSTDLHHSVDAVIVACVTDGNIHKITRYIQSRELRYTFNIPFVDPETGVIYRQAEFSRDEWDAKFGKVIPMPWTNFKTELEIRTGENPKRFIEQHKDVALMLDYPEDIMEQVRPIFVSRMPKHKISGAAHDETVRSVKYHANEQGQFTSEGMVVSKTSLDKLKLKDGEIENYFNPESDLLLYEALKRRLEEYNGDAAKAFAEKFYKPRSDGSRGPLVNKVKTYEKMTTGVLVNQGTGIAANGEMVRVDVFCEDGKYYLVPIYTADVVKKILPNKACASGKPYSKWKEMKDENFVFSLYSRDLIHIKMTKGVKVTTNTGAKEMMVGDILAYFVGTDIATASIKGEGHDKSFSFRGLGIQKPLIFEKCQVDVLGNITIVKKEARTTF